MILLSASLPSDPESLKSNQHSDHFILIIFFRIEGGKNRMSIRFFPRIAVKLFDYVTNCFVGGHALSFRKIKLPRDTVPIIYPSKLNAEPIIIQRHKCLAAFDELFI